MILGNKTNSKNEVTFSSKAGDRYKNLASSSLTNGMAPDIPALKTDSNLIDTIIKSMGLKNCPPIPPNLGKF